MGGVGWVAEKEGGAARVAWRTLQTRMWITTPSGEWSRQHWLRLIARSYYHALALIISGCRAESNIAKWRGGWVPVPSVGLEIKKE